MTIGHVTTTYPPARPLPMPAPRGPVTTALSELLVHRPWGTRVGEDLVWSGVMSEATTDDDLQLALFLVYELHHRGIEGVPEEWEWHPELVEASQEWEQVLLAGLRSQVAAPTFAVDSSGHDLGRRTADALLALATEVEVEPSVGSFLRQRATATQFAECLVQQSVTQLREGSPYAWALSRICGAPQAALLRLLADAYGSGRPADSRADRFDALLSDWGLDASYGAYLNLVPGVGLLASNIATLFGLNRRWRGALVGTLTLSALVAPGNNRHYAYGHRRLRGGEEAGRFFDEPALANPPHGQLAAYTLATELLRVEPNLAEDVLFGAGCRRLADELLGGFVLSRWDRGLSSLLEDDGLGSYA